MFLRIVYRAKAPNGPDPSLRVKVWGGIRNVATNPALAPEQPHKFDSRERPCARCAPWYKGDDRGLDT